MEPGVSLALKPCFAWCKCNHDQLRPTSAENQALGSQRNIYVIMHCISITCLSFRLGYKGHQRRGLTMEPFQLDSGDTSRAPGTAGRFFPGILQRHRRSLDGAAPFQDGRLHNSERSKPCINRKIVTKPKAVFLHNAAGMSKYNLKKGAHAA